MSLMYGTQVMINLVWHDGNEESRIKELVEVFGWAKADTYHKRTINGKESVTILIRICSYSDVQTTTGGPAFVKLTPQ